MSNRSIGIYGHGKNVRKAKSYHRISLVKGVEATQSVVDKTKHGKLRRILNQGLSDSYIRTFDKELTDIARLFSSSLGSSKDRFVPETDATTDGWTCAKNMAHWCELTLSYWGQSTWTNFAKVTISHSM